MSVGSTFKRCTCVDPTTGRPYTQASPCPRLRQRDHGSWTYAIDLPPGADGQRRYKGGFATKAQAQTALDKLREQLRADDEYDPTSTLTVAAWLDLWLTEKSKPTGSSAAGKKSAGRRPGLTAGTSTSI